MYLHLLICDIQDDHFDDNIYHKNCFSKKATKNKRCPVTIKCSDFLCIRILKNLCTVISIWRFIRRNLCDLKFGF